MDDGVAQKTGTNKGKEENGQVIVGITGASGIIYGIETVRWLKD